MAEGVFQSLIGIRFDFNLLYDTLPYGAIQLKFQSLIGIRFDFNGDCLKALPYLVFLVQFRQPTSLVAFQALAVQEVPFKNILKPSCTKAFRICDNFLERASASKPLPNKAYSHKFGSVKKNTYWLSQTFQKQR